MTSKCLILCFGFFSQLRLYTFMGSLPDASQEGLLEQFSSYASVAVFHYSVPSEITRATWEFASFQDRPDCPSREVNIHIQHGSFPVFSADNASFPDTFYMKRTAKSALRTMSEFEPTDSEVLPVYNPLPGSWFAVAYLSPFEQPHGLLKKCRYSLGSIALWTKADSVELIMPNMQSQSFVTRRHFSYFKFFVQEDVDAFKLVISNCKVQVRTSRPNFKCQFLSELCRYSSSSSAFPRLGQFKRIFQHFFRKQRNFLGNKTPKVQHVLRHRGQPRGSDIPRGPELRGLRRGGSVWQTAARLVPERAWPHVVGSIQCFTAQRTSIRIPTLQLQKQIQNPQFQRNRKCQIFQRR